MTDPSTSIRYQFDVSGGDFTKAGDASSKVKRILQQIGVNPEIVRRIAVACYEAEMNIVIHADHGTVTLEAGLGGVNVTVEDVGPGIADIEQAMVPGFSTAPDSVRELGFGAGMGLPNMKNCSSELVVESELGVGTRVRMEFAHG
jgi:serine/threonine-protein kinase RsbT